MKNILLGVLSPLLLLALISCQVYEVEVRVDSDGGGRRNVTLAILDSSIFEEGVQMRDYRKLFSVEKRDGWDFELAEDEGGWFEKKFGFFQRDREISGLKRWNRQSGDIHINGNKRRSGHGKIEFRNTVDVYREGERLVYCETFTWHGLREAILDIQSENFAKELKGAYPFLGRRELRELRELGTKELDRSLPLLLESGNEDEQVAMRIRHLAEQVAEIIRREKASAKLAAVSPAVENLLTDKNGQMERVLNDDYPGVALSFVTSLNLSVEMPGRIIGGNADRIEDGRAKWNFDLSRAIDKPLVLQVESRP
ncbi:hypothetical protein H8E52_00765 [bacterium]|nr:hypothetical protein [bacterium]